MTSAEVAARPKLTQRLFAWVMRNAHGPRAWVAMAAFAFAESSFFPLPPDVLLVPMLLADRKRAFLLGAWCTLWSVLGGALGYAIGHMLQPVAYAVIDFYHMQEDAAQFIGAFKDNIWLIGLQGLTPIPYKIVTISAGIAGVSFPVFMMLSAVARGVRFMGEATLFYFFGDRARVLLEKYLGPVLIGMLLLIVAGFAAVKYLF